MMNFETHVSEDAAANIKIWLTEPKYAEYKQELEKLIQDGQWQLLEDSFFKVIEFGTAGRRGTTGVGSNRINKVTMGESAQALCEYALQLDPNAASKGIVIAYDTRLTSEELSEYCARVCAAAGFKTYLFEGYRSTPELSFAVRHLKAAVGIVVSASHNPPQDNGFKAYWSDGAQLVAPHDKGVVQQVKVIRSIATVDFDQAVSNGSIVMIGQEVDSAYLDAAAKEAISTDRDLSIVYSPLHGAGQTNVLPLLREQGFSDITVVDEQMTPDGNFPSVKNNKPNPEERAANDAAASLLLNVSADIAITNDPDADRFGVMVRVGDEVKYLTGNESAVLATDFVLTHMKSDASLTPEHFIVKTIVTTDLMSAIAASHGIRTYGDLLIGFKYIGELIKEKESTTERFVLGAEESYGLLKGTYARDKDGASGALLMAEYAAQLKRDGKTLLDRLYELYEQHGVYRERLDSVYFEGASGFAKMQDVMTSLRTSPPSTVGSHPVTSVYDYVSLSKTDMTSGANSDITSLSSNMIVLECGDSRRRITIRPSGTEPKIKLYVQWQQERTGALVHQVAELDATLERTARVLEKDLLK